MSEMIERVARAICQADEQNGGAPWDWYGSDKARSGYFDSARAAIEAMREPSTWSVEQARRYAVAAGFDIPAEAVRNMLRAAIDAALSQSGE